MKLFVLILGFLILLVSCRGTLLFKDDELTLEREDYDGSELKLDGYYYEDFITGDGREAQEVYFLYRNGILLYGTVLIGDDDVLLEMYRSGEFARHAKDKTYWGVFQIDSNIIKFERWYPSSGGGAPTAIKEGKILNDTTFHITEGYKIKKGKKVGVVEVNRVFHFKAFSPKPDSTNTFVK